MDILILYVYQNRTTRGKNNIKNKILSKEKVESEDININYTFKFFNQKGYNFLIF